MRLRLFALSLLGSATACSLLLDLPGEEGRACDDGRCKPGYECEANVCVKQPVCEPACADWAQCVSHTCEPRYAEILLKTPVDLSLVDAGSQPVVAELRLRPGRRRRDPATLVWSARAEANGALTTGLLHSDRDGGYQGAWTATVDGIHELKVSYPDAELVSVPVTVRADLAAPDFEILVPPPDRHGDGGVFRDRDPQLPDAWRRDEVVKLTVRANATDVDPGSVRLVVVGVADGGQPGRAEPAGQVEASSPCDRGYCGSYTVRLWEPHLDAFRGALSLRLMGTDRVGNVRAVTVELPLTRWRWDYDTGASIRVSPAVGNTGNVYVGTSNGTSGAFLALSPEGTVLWQRATAPIASSPSVGQLSGGRETVFFASSGASGNLMAVDGADGGVLGQCSVSGDHQGALAVGPTTSSGDTVESAVGVMNSATASSGQLVILRPSSLVDQCINRSGLDNVSAAGGVAMNGKNIYYPDTKGRIQGFTTNTSGIANRGNWPVSLGEIANALAFSGFSVVGGSERLGEGSLFAIDEVTGQVFWRPRFQAKPWVPAITALHQVLIGADNNTVLAQTLGSSGEPRSVQVEGVIQGAPALGQGGFVYAADVTGTLHVRTGDLTPIWALSDPSLLGMVIASVNLDCARDAARQPIPGRPGTLYVASSNGRLFAFVVDSRGIDTTADWPRFQHDPGNTGNAATPLSSFACP